MSSIQIKEYLSKVLELETAVYTQGKIIEKYKEHRKNNIPQKPIISLPQEPSQITEQEYFKSEWTHFDGDTYTKCCAYRILSGISLMFALLWTCFALPSMFGIYSPSIDEEAVWSMIWLPLITYPLAAFLIYKFFALKKEVYQLIDKENRKYKIASEQYKKNLEEYNKAKRAIEQEHIASVSLYNIELSNYNTDTIAQLNGHNELLSKLQTSLQNLYDVGVIYPKYRNIIAVSTMYEYIDSGRCASLDGTDGAYNMYESELRQNIIIGSLSQILSNVQQIKNNQFALFQQLQYANETIFSVMQDISNSARLTAYFTQATAIAASADRYTVGIIY